MTVHIYGCIKGAPRPIPTVILCGKDFWNEQLNTISMFGNYHKIKEHLCEECISLLPIAILNDNMDPSEDLMSEWDVDPTKELLLDDY